MRHVPFVEAAHILMGQSPDGDTYNKSKKGLPLLNGPSEFGLITPSPVQWTTNPAKFAEQGDILFCVRGNTLGRQNLADQSYAIGRGLAAIRAKSGIADTTYISLWLRHVAEQLLDAGSGSTFPNISGGKLETIDFPLLPLDEQRRIAARLKAQLAAVEEARQAAQAQRDEITNLANAIIRQSLAHPATESVVLGDVLAEVKTGIGATWADYPVLGATREGLAPAKDPVGKHPARYKPVFANTVFYNPMRILIGSIAMVDEEDAPGITSPDYVALRGREGLVDSRWFYYWLRSPDGAHCIASLARGAVRERMLFNRLAEGEIALPPYAVQRRASEALKEIRPMKTAVENQLQEIELLPSRLLAQAFEM